MSKRRKRQSRASGPVATMPEAGRSAADERNAAERAATGTAGSATGAAPASASASVEPATPLRRRGLAGRAWAAWVELWDRREPATSLALCRMMVAAVLLADLLQARSYGLVGTIWAPPPDGLGWGMQGSNAAAAARWFGATAGTGALLWWTAAVSSVLVVAGVATRLSILVLALTWAQLGHFAPDSDRGIDFMLRAVLLVLLFSQCHACWSVDAWFRRRIGRPFASVVPSWPRYVIFAQLLWIYFSAGHNKTDKAWGPIGEFTALNNILTDPHFARFDPSWVATFYPLLQLAALATMIFELTSPVMILLTWWNSTSDRPGRLRRLSNFLRLRWVWILTGLSFHVGIAVTMRLGVFPWGMVALYPVLFRPDEIHRAIAWLQSHIPRGLARSPSG